jgi:hypothetical protein
VRAVTVSKGKSRVIKQFTINKPYDEVMRDLRQEGCTVIRESEGKALCRFDKDVRRRIRKSKDN